MRARFVRFAAAGFAVCFLVLLAVPELAGATPSEPTCSATASGDSSLYLPPTSYSLTCSGVTGSGVEVFFELGDGNYVSATVTSVDWIYGPGPDYAALPASFTVDQSYVNPSDDSVPGAIDVQSFDVFPDPDSGYPASGVGQFGLDSTEDSCVSAGVGCGTVTFAAADPVVGGFSSLGSGLLGGMGLAVALVLAVLLLSVGLRLLLKWARRATAT